MSFERLLTSIGPEVTWQENHEAIMMGRLPIFTDPAMEVMCRFHHVWERWETCSRRPRWSYGKDRQKKIMIYEENISWIPLADAPHILIVRWHENGDDITWVYK